MRRWKWLHLLSILPVRIELRTRLYIWGQKITRLSRKSLFAAQVVPNRCITVLLDVPSAQVHVIGNHSAKDIELVDAV